MTVEVLARKDASVGLVARRINHPLVQTTLLRQGRMKGQRGSRCRVLGREQLQSLAPTLAAMGGPSSCPGTNTPWPFLPSLSPLHCSGTEQTQEAICQLLSPQNTSQNLQFIS